MNSDGNVKHSPDEGNTEVINDEASRKTVVMDGAPSVLGGLHGTLGGASVNSLYRIQAKVGGGGMGVVYLARDVKLGRYVALKRLNAQSNANLALRRRFLNEAKAVASLNHIHIVHIYALGEDAEGPYIAMEYVSGPAATTGSRQLGEDAALPHSPVSLDKQVAENGQYTVNEAVDLLVKITKAVAYAHANGVIHRDLKPSNILLDETGEPKIVDFGLARLNTENESKLTVPGEKLLSLGYGAPEQENDASVSDERADIYGLGGILYFAITGQNPRYFREQDIPASLRETLVKALATDREQRWPTARAFLESLYSVQSRTKVEPSPAKTTWRCKWCDTVNPITIRFCSECGWDGAETCPECGTENFIGMQYCGKCGSDLRVYESMLSLSNKIRAAVDADEYEKAVMLSSRAQGFDPAGPSGRAILKDLRQMCEHAQRQISRRDQLKDIIPMEIRAENYERARGFIEEYRKLSGNNAFYTDEYAQIPSMIVRRDLKRARRALYDHDYSFAQHLCEMLLETVDPDNHDCLAMRRQIITRRIVRRTLFSAGAVILVLLVYMLAFPFYVKSVQHGSESRFMSAFFHPAHFLYLSDTPLGNALGAYAKLLKIGNIPVELKNDSVQELVEPLKLAELRKEYQDQLDEISRDNKAYDREWREQYVDGMKSLGNRQREAGNYHEWQRVEAELKQFVTSGEIGPVADDEPTELKDLRQKYLTTAEGIMASTARRRVLATRRYLQNLSELLREFTKQGNKQAAALVDAEYNRVSNSQDFKDAENIAKRETVVGAEAAKTPVLKNVNLKEIEPIREKFNSAVAKIEDDCMSQVKAWPVKYSDALMRLLQKYQDNGDYNGCQATQGEIDRFDVDGTLVQQNVSAEFEGLALIQREYIALYAKYRLDRAQALLKAAEEAIHPLEALRMKFTKENNMDLARAADEEIRRISELQDIVAARAEVNNAEATKQ